ncbi:MAG: hypothetical protein LQ338_001404 [Usnochroma carphineum]|nr:MAG: hypothetical protein LQ338_001404 [Usnochroma carphineum]
MDAFESLQELTRHLAIQEMDFELYISPEPGSEPKLVATGCLAFTDCGQEASNASSRLNLHPPANVKEPDSDIITEWHFVDPPGSPPVPTSNFADVACIFYRRMIEMMLSSGGGGLLMPVEQRFGASPPLHRYQMSEAGFSSWLYIVIAQDWNSQYNFTLLDIAKLLQFGFRPRLADGTLRTGTRGTLTKEQSGQQEHPNMVGGFCMWYVNAPSICDELFHLAGNGVSGKDANDTTLVETA